jgi:ankyrin repeat protein
MSEWDELEPHEKRYKLAQDPVAAARIVAADRQMIAALLSQPIDLKNLRAALKDDANPDRHIINGFPALHVAIEKHDIKALEILLRYSARTDDIDAEGRVALDVAHRRHFKEAVKLLELHGAETRLAKGEEPDLSDDYAPNYQRRINNLLNEMVRKGTAEQVQQMIDLGAQVNHIDPHSNPGFPMLHHAACLCDVEKVKILLANGADPLQKSSRGHDVTDTMWQARIENLYSEKWLQIHDLVREAGYTNLFEHHPLKLDANDLRQKVVISGPEDPTLMQYLVDNNQGDRVLDILARDASKPLTAQELSSRLESKTMWRGSLLESFGRAGKLSRIFTAAVWQGRVDEMLSLRAAVEKNPMFKPQVDFDTAYNDVMAQRLKILRAKAPKLKL